MLTAIVLAAWVVRSTKPSLVETDSWTESPAIAQDGVSASDDTGAHPNYRYSVVPGGVHSAQDLVDAISSDEVVAEHYATLPLDLNRVRVEKLPETRRAYVSYRVGDQVYWTKNKVTLPAGEPILTDGKAQIRGRCGNCISYEARFPTSDSEPETVEFDALAPPVPDLSNPSAPGMLAAPALPSSRTTTAHLAPPVAAGGGAPGGGGAASGLASSGGGAAGGSGRPSGLPPLVSAPGPESSGAGEDSLSPGIVPIPELDGPIGDFSIPVGGGPNGPGGTGSPGGPGGPGGLGPGTLGPGDLGLGGPGGPEGSNPGSLVPTMPIGPGAGGNDQPVTQPEQPVPIPEPGTLLLFGTGAAGMLWRRLRSRNSNS